MTQHRRQNLQQFHLSQTQKRTRRRHRQQK
jgi:hypothetical protein